MLHDSVGNCFYRASTNWNVREWGAHCDVVPIFNTGTYPGTGGASTFDSGSALLDNGKDSGKYIVIPMIGAAPYYPFQSTTNSPGSAGSGYSANDILTFVGGTSAAGPATIQVDMVDGTTGAVTAWHFLTYGAYSVPAGTHYSSGGTTVMTTYTGVGTGFKVWTQWAGQTYTDTIASVSTSGHTITLTHIPPYPSGLTANPGEWYYGSDDSAAINTAIQSVNASGTPGLTIPGNCGSTIQINGNNTQAVNNPMLLGKGQASTGLYALAAIPAFLLATTGTTNGTVTVSGLGTSIASVNFGDTVSGPDFAFGTTVAGVDDLHHTITLNQNATGSHMGTKVTFVRDSGHLYNRPSANRGYSGGGLSNMTVEAMGLTQDAPVEVDGGKEQTYADLWVRNGTGAGNSNFRCGSALDSNADAGGITYRDVRAETDSSVLPGALFPDTDMDLDNGCHDSFVSRPVGVNATLANIMHLKADGLHIENPHTFNALYPDVPGAADYGIATALDDYIIGAQIDDANFADAILAPRGNLTANGQRLIETRVGCASLKGPGVPAAFTLSTQGNLTNNSTAITGVLSVTGAAVGMIVVGIGIPLGDKIVNIPSGSEIDLASPATTTAAASTITVTGGFRGVEISDGDAGATVTATFDTPGCLIADSALVQQDGMAVSSTAVFGNSHASYSTMHSVYGSIVYSATNFGGSATLSNQYHACVSPGLLAPTITLPSSPTPGLQYTVDDCSGGAGAHHITVMPAAGFIDGSTTYVISTNYGSWTGYYTGLRWKTIATR